MATGIVVAAVMMVVIVMCFLAFMVRCLFFNLSVRASVVDGIVATTDGRTDRRVDFSFWPRCSSFCWIFKRKMG